MSGVRGPGGGAGTAGRLAPLDERGPAIPRKPAVKNANRRLGDRLWSARGVEFHRVMGTTYFLGAEQIAAVLDSGPVGVGLLRDHSAVDWQADWSALRAALTPGGAVRLDGRTFRGTLWHGPGGQAVLLLEEDH